MLYRSNLSANCLDRWAVDSLEQLRAVDQERTLTTYDTGLARPQSQGQLERQGKAYLNFSSNDYLALSCCDEVVAALSRTPYVGAGASRLVTGNRSSHDLLECELAEFCRYPSALLFGSGYLANLGVLSSLVGRDDLVFSDRLIHASLIDGIRLSGARHLRFRHNDMNHLAELLQREKEKSKAQSRFLVVTESLFSMTGDLAPLEDLVTLAEEVGAIVVVDEAHALGVFGLSGRGRVAELGLSSRVQVCTASFGKSFGSYGGVALCSPQVRAFLVNSARSLIYNTSLPTAIVEASRASLKMMLDAPHLGATLRERAQCFGALLQNAGFSVESSSQIMPLCLGENQAVVEFAERLRARGIVVAAIRPPTVPKGAACVRLSMTLHHSTETLTAAAELFSEELGGVNR